MFRRKKIKMIVLALLEKLSIRLGSTSPPRQERILVGIHALEMGLRGALWRHIDVYDVRCTQRKHQGTENVKAYWPEVDGTGTWEAIGKFSKEGLLMVV